MLMCLVYRTAPKHQRVTQPKILVVLRLRPGLARHTSMILTLWREHWGTHEWKQLSKDTPLISDRAEIWPQIYLTLKPTLTTLAHVLTFHSSPEWTHSKTHLFNWGVESIWPILTVASPMRIATSYLNFVYFKLPNIMAPHLDIQWKQNSK